MICPKCGEQLPTGARFCGACGSRLAPEAILAKELHPVPEETKNSKMDPVRETLEQSTPDAEQISATGQGNEPVSGASTAPKNSSLKTRKNNVLPILLVGMVVIVIIAVNVIIAMMPTEEERWQEQYDLGQQYLLELDYEQAIVAFTAAIEIDENNVEAYIGRAEAYLGDDVTDASEENLIFALSDYETALSIDDTMAQVYADRGQVYQTLGSMEEALSDYNAALSLDASLVEIYACRGHVYLALGDSESALNDYETAVELDAADEEVYLCAAQICMDQGDYDRAAEFLEKGEAAYPESEDIRELADEVTAILEEQETRKRYQAYYDKLMELQEEYGEAETVDDVFGWDNSLVGLFLAELIDFDGDGTEELLLAYRELSTEDTSNRGIEVWAWQEDGILRVYEGTGWISNNGIFVYLSYVDGQYYIMEGNGDEGGGDRWHYDEILEYTDGTFQSLIWFGDQFDSNEELVYRIDDTYVSSDEYYEEHDLWWSDTTCYSFQYVDSYCADYDPRPVLEETFAALREYLGYGDSTVDEASDDGEADCDVSAELDWAAIYLNYLEALTPTENEIGTALLQMNDLYYLDQFSLIYVNDDDIPELIMYGGYGYVSGLALTIDGNGTVNELDLYRDACSYLPGENILDNNDAMSGSYHDRIYSIIDGHWTLLAEGSYYGNWDENDEMYYYDYTWNGTSVTAAEYDVLVAEYMDLEESSTPDDSYTLEELKVALESQRQ